MSKDLKEEWNVVAMIEITKTKGKNGRIHYDRDHLKLKKGQDTVAMIEITKLKKMMRYGCNDRNHLIEGNDETCSQRPKPPKTKKNDRMRSQCDFVPN